MPAVLPGTYALGAKRKTKTNKKPNQRVTGLWWHKKHISLLITVHVCGEHKTAQMLDRKPAKNRLALDLSWPMVSVLGFCPNFTHNPTCHHAGLRSPSRLVSISYSFGWQILPGHPQPASVVMNLAKMKCCYFFCSFDRKHNANATRASREMFVRWWYKCIRTQCFKPFSYRKRFF